jgi:hypothetical protein
MSGIRVTATDLDHPEDTSSIEIMDNYVLIAAGSCEQTYVQVHNKSDGTQTHVITVKGVRQGGA